jgi:hypothetical protein
MMTPDNKIKAIVSLEFPRTLPQLETYLGMMGALRQYVPLYAKNPNHYKCVRQSSYAGTLSRAIHTANGFFAPLQVA